MAEKVDNPNDSRASPPIEVAAEANENLPPDLVNLCKDAFKKTSDYLQGELLCTAEDYRMLEQMNRVTIAKYAEMAQIGDNIARSMKHLNEKYQSLQPYLDQIDQIEVGVASLEEAAYKIDTYSKRLEAKFKQLEKR